MRTSTILNIFFRNFGFPGLQEITPIRIGNTIYWKNLETGKNHHETIKCLPEFAVIFLGDNVSGRE